MSMDQFPPPGMQPDQTGMPADWQYPPQKPGIGCGCKVLIVLGILFVLLAALCCGGVVWLFTHFAGSVSDDSQTVVSTTEKVVKIDVPEGLEPVVSQDLDVPVSGQKLWIWVAYADESTQSVLVLSSLGELLSSQDQQTIVEQQIDEILRSQGLTAEGDVDKWESYEKEIEVRGQTVSFGFTVGKNEDSEVKRIEVTGTFEGEAGPVTFSFRGDAEKYDEETIVEMLESIR